MKRACLATLGSALTRLRLCPVFRMDPGYVPHQNGPYPPPPTGVSAVPAMLREQERERERLGDHVTGDGRHRDDNYYNETRGGDAYYNQGSRGLHQERETRSRSVRGSLALNVSCVPAQMSGR